MHLSTIAARYSSHVDEPELLTEADDALDDDCICAPGCDHDAQLLDDVSKTTCDPECPIHGGNL